MADQRIEGGAARIQSGHEAAAILAEDYNSRGAAYAAKGLRNRAIADYTQAIAIDPDNDEAYINRGGAYFAQGLRDQAIAG